MAEEVTHLIIKVSSDDAAAASQRLKQLGYDAKTAESATSGLSKATDAFMGTVKQLLGPLAAFVSITAGLTKLVNTSRQFEVLTAQLKTATGSAKNADEAFEALVQFAQNTPYDLAQTVDAFIKLTNLGLTPSERALKAYGNTASAMGKSLEDMVLAVSNATVGEFLTLRQFGIKARTEAEGIRFIFRGTSTLVKNDAKAIEDYFITLGESKFAGAMAEKMNTLDGAISNLGDAWDVLFATIGKSGAADLIKDGILAATSAITELTDMIKSGELSKEIEALAFKFSSLTDGITVGFAALTQVIQDAFHYWGTDGKETANFIIDAFKNMPENIRAYVQVMGARFGALVEYAKAIGKGIYDGIATWFNYLVDTAVNVGKKIYDAIRHPFDGKFNYTEAQAKAFEKFANDAVDTWTRTKTAIDGTSDAFDETVTSIMDERDAAISAFTLQMGAAQKLRAEYDKLKQAKADAAKGNDRLAKFAVGGTDHLASEEERRKFEALRDSLRAEEFAIVESYKKRMTLILDNTKAGSALQVELTRELNARVTEEYERAFVDRTQKILKLEEQLRVAVAAGRISEVEMLSIQLQNEENHLKESYEARRQQILSDTSITEEQKLKRLASLEQKYTQQQRDFELARQKATLDRAADFFGNLATIAGAFGKKGAKIAKAAAIIQTTIKTYESATSAYSALAGIPYIGPALGAAAAGAAIAAGMANVAAIRQQSDVPGYAIGGMIPAGDVGLVGEAGLPELVKGPAVVTGGRTTRDKGLNGASPQNVKLVFNNYGASIEKESDSMGPDGRTVTFIVKAAVKAVAQDFRDGKGEVSRAAKQAFGLRAAV